MDYPDATDYEFERGFLHFLWAPLAVGAAGNLHPWVSPKTWPELTLQKLQWISGFSGFCSRIKWNEFNSRNINDKISADNENVKVFASADSKEMLIYLMNDDPENKFEPVRVNLDLSVEMDPGQYRIEWIDIRTGKTISSKKLKDLNRVIESPEFRDGLFGHIRKI
jgi:hypothetical protein